jgi:hypothetical protein
MVNKGGKLCKEFHLRDSDADEPPLTVSVDDFYDLLYSLWTSTVSIFVSEALRIQTHLLLLICAYTGSRPGAVLGTQSKSSLLKKKYLQFQHCKIILLKDEEMPAEARPLRALEVKFLYRKNKAVP